MLQHFDTVMSFAVVMLLLSLLVTTLVQMIIAASGLRSSVLQGGLERLLTQSFPALTKEEAATISKAVLRHPMIQHVKGRGATSIRKEELIRLLQDMAIRNTTHAPEKVKELFAAAHTALNRVTPVLQSPELTTASEALKKAIENAFPEQVSEVTRRVDQALAGGRQLMQEAGSWFDAVMDRTTENFLAKTRWITAGVAAALAFYLHVDSLSIIRQLASQPELRAKLIQSADATLQRAENTMALTVSTQAIASAAIATISSNSLSAAEGKILAKAPRDLATRGAGEDWLKANLENSANRSAIIAAYHEQFEEKSKVWLGALSHSAKELHTALHGTDLIIIPSPTPPLFDYFEKPGHFLGTVMTVFFLSLGAPFWYNALRQLANLRPAVAEKIEPKSQRK
jgi:hypothetical protein